jgi:PIN domain nuclease of toxin-antitoxin system
MRLLLDTHAFLWWASEPTKLSGQVLSLCQDPATDLMLSVASLWEIQIKAQLGKLTLTAPLPALITAQRQVNALRLLPVELEHVLALDALPPHHKDPFDRLLIAQANCENAVIASTDAAFANYPVTCIW